ncbi:hypothetical protein V5P93_006225 [Actinokineospora auranticolor]|uniref:Uncharacterized protein n=1 Tax=Actinokineospora auranticolor TaxID=155976 RepID=A0A2S6GHW0_9PSEU|nr:hypothetical protein [Actinokineospora auranticolor]PPK64822.1 hypothetical protein CLV40_11761 [Actinokineospora auranticolor]
MNGHVDLVRELKSLRKGRGLFVGRIEDRVGPTLRLACAITEFDGRPVIRRKVTDRLADLSNRLPEDLRLAARVAFAIEADARFPLYQDRVRWASEQIDRDVRTVRRRVDEAIDHLAELANDTPAPEAGAPAAWHLVALSAALALDGPRPEVLEHHRITAAGDGLRELDLETTCRAADLRVHYGGTLTDQGRFRLPFPLARGESHTFAIRAQPATPPTQLLFRPDQPGTRFDLRVRFGRERVPAQVRSVRGAAGGELPGGSPHPVDDAGEVHIRFDELVPGRVYGARW